MSVFTPGEVIAKATESGAQKALLARKQPKRLLVLAIVAGAYIALGAILSLIAGWGFQGITAENPSLQKLLSGATFPIGLILIVILGGELFTGNNAMLIPSYMSERCTVGDIAKNWTLVYFGNMIGAVLFVYLFVYSCGLTASGPYHEAAIKIAEGKVAMPWMMVMLKGIGANWCVCLAVWLAMSGKRLIEKMAACWLPVMAFVALGYEHSIANMAFLPMGMLEGAKVGLWDAVWNNLIPATIGNIIGGALLVGMLHAALHLKRAN